MRNSEILLKMIGKSIRTRRCSGSWQNISLVFFWREETNILLWGRCFVFKVNTYQIPQYISLPSIVVTNSIVIAAESNYTRCKYEHM